MSVNGGDTKNIDLKAAFKNAANGGSAKPLVIACIGQDDPHRGDTHGTIGLAKTIAEMIDGEYVYIDQSVVQKHFNDAADYDDRAVFGAKLSAYLKQFPKPNFLLGRHSSLDALAFFSADGMNETGFMGYNNCVNEVISELNGEGLKSLVAHDVTPAMLAAEGQVFSQHYPDLAAPLLGIFMGGDPDLGHETPQGMCPEINAVAQKIADISAHYNALDCFIMPCRRTGQARYEAFQDDLQARIAALNTGGAKTIRVMGQDYDAAVNDYNPYRGLIARADHFAVIGYSLSMLSEVLSAGKNVYLSDTRLYELKALEDKGYIQNILALDDAPFPTREIPECNVTGKIARNMALEYLKVKNEAERNGMPVYTRPITGMKA
jgi:hypothetical protein